MTWFAFQGLNGGQAIDLAGTQEKEAVAEGFHGYATQAQAQAAPNSVNLLTRALADVWIADYKAAVKEGAQPGGPNDITTLGGAAKAAAKGAGLVIPGLTQVGAFFASLGEKNLWIRAAKIIAGGALVVIGLAHITGAGNEVMTIARKAPLPV